MPTKITRTWRRLRLAHQGDPTSAIRTPAAALSAADVMLTRVAVAELRDTLWTSTAVEPLAVVLLAAGPAGTGRGMPWTRKTVAQLHYRGDDSTDWGTVGAAVGTSTWARRILARVTQLDPRQRRSVTNVMLTAIDLAQKNLAGAALSGAGS